MSGEKDELQELEMESDAALFEGAAGETEKETPEPVVVEKEEAEPETPEAKADETEKLDTTAEQDKGLIPSWRLREEADARKEAVKALETERSERAKLVDRLARLEKPTEQKADEPPDPLIDPQGYSKWQDNRLDLRLRQERGEMSMRYTRKQNPEVFDKAYAAITDAMSKGDRLSQLRVYNSPDPGEELIAWYKEAETRREVGNDPATYKARVLEEALKDPTYLAKAIEAAKASAGGAPAQTNGGARPVVKLPPSLTGAARADAASMNSDDNDVSDEGLMSYALR